MSGKPFGSNIEVNDTIIDYFDEQNKLYYIEHKKCEHFLIKCIELEKDYILKIKFCFKTKLFSYIFYHFLRIYLYYRLLCPHYSFSRIILMISH